MAEIPTPDTVALVRRRYAEGAQISVIAAESGIKNWGTIYRCVAGRYPDGSGKVLEPLPRRRTGVRIYRGVGSRAALVGRIWRAAQKQVEDIEDRLDAAGLPLEERESNSRILAALARTLRELNAVDESRRSRRKTAKTKDDERPPRNVDDLRAALARKLEAFIARTGDGVSGDPE